MRLVPSRVMGDAKFQIFGFDVRREFGFDCI
jgi:hypothetical protein